MTPTLVRAYRRTTYRFDCIQLQVGRRCAAVDALIRENRARMAIAITAHNPRSRRMPDAWNQRMQRRLAGNLRRLKSYAGSGSWRGWREAHYLVLAPIAPMMRLARQFRQNGIVIVRPGQPVRLLIPSSCNKAAVA